MRKTIDDTRTTYEYEYGHPPSEGESTDATIGLKVNAATTPRDLHTTIDDFDRTTITPHETFTFDLPTSANILRHFPSISFERFLAIQRFL